MQFDQEHIVYMANRAYRGALGKRAILSNLSLVTSYSEGKNISTTLVINDDDWTHVCQQTFNKYGISFTRSSNN